MEEETQTFQQVGLESPITTTSPPSGLTESSTPPDSPTAIRNSSATVTIDDQDQLEPTQDEIETERLIAKAEQLQDDIMTLRAQLQEKENELSEVKQQLGITPYTEFKDGVAHGWKVMGDKWKELQETSTFRKIDSTLSGWKTKVEDSEKYKKTVSSFNEGGKKASASISHTATNIRESETVKTIGSKTSAAFQRTGTALKNTGTAIKENERVQSIGDKIRTTSVRIKDRVMGTSVDEGEVKEDGEENGENSPPVTKETVVPDMPPTKDD